MQPVKKKWLDLLSYGLLGLDALFAVIFLIHQTVGLPESIVKRWGIATPVLIVAVVHALYVLVIYPWFSKKMTWLSSVISIVLFAMVMTTIIDYSGNTNLVYRLGYATLIFFTALTGVFLPLAGIILTWVVLVFSLTGTVSGSQATPQFNIIIDLIVTAAGICGWLIFKPYYQRPQEVTTLSEMLKQEQFKSSIILESITDGVLVVNTKGIAQIINVSGATMFGWDKADATNLDYKSLYEMESATDKPQDESQPNPFAGQNKDNTDAIAATLTSGLPQQKVVQIKTKHNKHLFVDIVVSPIFEDVVSTDQEGQPTKKLVGAIAVFRDVDKQKREEQQRSDFISTASHEMRTPVASIQGFLELAINPKVCTIDDKARGYLDKARLATVHLGELFQDLLTVSKTDDGRLTNDPKVLNLSTFLKEVVDTERAVATKKNLTLNFDASGGIGSDKHIAPLMHVYADPDRLREVMINLIDNAIKYTTQGMVTVGASIKDQAILIRVTDTGSGIAEEDIPHLFQKFYRVDNSATREIGGTGLGLYICRQIVEMMQGKIWVESTLGAGSTFYVQLPRVTPETLPAQPEAVETVKTQPTKA
jgi:two-component system, OmpR family, sensor histidine kinase VicK